MTIMIEIEYGSGDDGEWTSRIDISIGAEDCWSLSLRRGSISNNRRGPGQTDVPIDHESWHSKDAITVCLWHGIIASST